MWLGEGWQKTRRQLGVVLIIAAFAVESGLHANLPIALYGAITGLLGLDILAEALSNLQPRMEPSKGDR